MDASFEQPENIPETLLKPDVLTLGTDVNELQSSNIYCTEVGFGMFRFFISVRAVHPWNKDSTFTLCCMEIDSTLDNPLQPLNILFAFVTLFKTRVPISFNP